MRAINRVADSDRFDEGEHRGFVALEGREGGGNILSISFAQSSYADVSFQSAGSAIGADDGMAWDGDIDLSEMSG